jgi:thiol:disulfide interchange protein
LILSVLGVLGGNRAAVAQMRRPRADVTAITERTNAHAGDSVRVALKVTLPEGVHTQSNKPSDDSFIPTELTVDAPFTVKEIVWPPSADLNQVGLDKPLKVFEQAFTIGVTVGVPADAPAGPIAVPASLRYQACDANLCYPPTSAHVEWKFDLVASSAPLATATDPLFASIKFGSGEKGSGGSSGAKGSGGAKNPNSMTDLNSLNLLNQFEVAGTTGGYQGSSDFLKFIKDAESGVKQRGMFEGRGPLAILLIVLLGGLALNLTPCVLPMIPINLAIIGAGAHASSRARGFFLGTAYGVAMAIVYGVIGLVVILTAGSFGTINSSPWFNAGIAILFVVLGLAMFDVLLIDFSQYAGNLGTGASKGSVVLAFSMGAVAALLAGACVAPVVIQVVLFSSNLYATGTKIALALPFCLGIGMAIPWPIAGAGLAALPKPGMWMVRVKQAFGVFILLTAAYYGYQSYELFANRWVDASAVSASVDEQIKEGWHSSLAEGLDAATREGKPVLIDMWATWCKNCLTMDKTTLQNADVRSALAGYVKVKFQAEDPDEPPAKSVMQRFDAVGLPAYVILKPKRPARSS